MRECGACGTRKNGVLEEEIMKKYERDKDKLGSDKAIGILGDRWWPQAAKQEEKRIKSVQRFYDDKQRI